MKHIEDIPHPEFHQPSSPELPELSDENFYFISKLVRDKFGIVLTEAKRTLVMGRLHNVLHEMNMTGFDEYRTYLQEHCDTQTLADLANHITTNHTFFFREPEHFSFLSKVVLPKIAEYHQQMKNHDIRIWCAASSSGEEPYSIMMTMMDYFGPRYNEWDAGLLATDISTKALALAEKGEYHESTLQHMNTTHLHGYFDWFEEEKFWRVKSMLRREVTFRRFNLLNNYFPFKKPFDIIFCRNVMIYFDNEMRKRLIDKFAAALHPGGYLFVGHCESFGRSHPAFEYVMPAVYRRL